MRFSANTGFLWKDRPFLDRIAAARAAGFEAVEFHDEWRDHDPDAIRDALDGMPVLGLNVRMGETAGCAAMPGGQARADIDAAVAMARALGAGGVHVLAGKVERNDDSIAAYVANLTYACDAGPDLTILIEPLCARAMPVYPLRRIADIATLRDRVGAPNLRAMFDLFHVSNEGDDPVATYRAHADIVGHVQIADPETRGEPRGIGDTLRALRDAGYDRPFGCEYVPAGTVEEGLSWRDEV
ncbi:TIM barrel protein [Jannaschia sp. LMIT008]|uniref:TIM barrel protein n=1 Tax=Jannaschia maritima TaxID=3032585 RepID=UPI002810CDA7|nr:TIM barrel protein [Jannaschia sp. LMIT008]